MTTSDAHHRPPGHRPDHRPGPHPARRAVAGSALAAVGLLLLVGCGSVTVGGGATVSQQRDVPDVTAVTLRTPGRLNVTVGPTTRLTVTAGERLLDRLTSEVHDGHLELGLPGRALHLGPITYDLVVPDLDTLRVDGAGTVHGALDRGDRLDVQIDGAADIGLTGVDVDVLRVTINGAGTVEVRGRADRQDLGIRGAGEYRGTDLESGDATVEIDGAGRARMWVTERLEADISGAGEVRYSGDPSVRSDVDGIGRVVHD